jgi:hypothetical protein
MTRGNLQENPKAALQAALSSPGHSLFLCSDEYHVLFDMAEKKQMMGKDTDLGSLFCAIQMHVCSEQCARIQAFS